MPTLTSLPSEILIKVISELIKSAQDSEPDQNFDITNLSEAAENDNIDSACITALRDAVQEEEVRMRALDVQAAKDTAAASRAKELADESESSLSLKTSMLRLRLRLREASTISELPGLKSVVKVLFWLKQIQLLANKKDPRAIVKVMTNNPVSHQRPVEFMKEWIRRHDERQKLLEKKE